MGNYLSNNAGDKAAPSAVHCNPISGSGITISLDNTGNDYVQDIEANEIYAATINGGFCLFSITGVTSMPENIEWCGTDGGTIIIEVPANKIVLYCESDTDDTRVYLRKLR